MSGDDYVELDDGRESDDDPRVSISDETDGRGVSDSDERTERAYEDVREHVEGTFRRGVDSLDRSLVELVSSFLDTETRAKIYLCLRRHGEATSDEVAEETGLYPSTVRETLAELHDEGVVERRKKQTEGAGNKPYLYTAVQPSELARRFSETVETRLNRLFNLDSYLEGEDGREIDAGWSPYRIVIEENDRRDENDDGGN